MTVHPTRQFVEGLPKAELHVHLEGTLEPELKLALARKNGVDIGQTTIEEVRAAYEYDDLTSFLAVYYPAMEVLRDASDFEALASAYLERAERDGVRRAECFFDPQAHTSRGVPLAEVIEGLSAAVEKFRARGMSVDLILCILRDHPLESGLATLEEALAFRDRFIGVGLDSDERGNPPEKFARVFELARRNGLRLTMHCDPDQPDSIDHIRTCLTELGTDRLDHAVNIVEDPALVDLVVERGIGLTCCPLSNLLISPSMKEEEIVSLMRAGARATINSDDPAYFGGYVADNYLALAERAGLDESDLGRFARNSLEASWAPDDVKAALLAELDDYLAGS
ncbi:adenosine deaminase [Actinomyces culturomici]|uniref:adenosine deaminase n=1 Tax=Actinomyces culturomici TaxID=1926276 RepID=UPI000E20577E|nr:adenosine deaminase [Actinomyces culturomici]